MNFNHRRRAMLARLSDWSDWPNFGFADFGRGFPAHAALRRELDRVLGEFERSAGSQRAAPAVTFEDEGASFTFRADVPGLTEKDFQINVAGNTLTLRGERKLEAPEKYSAHRRERSEFRFAKSFELPARVDADKATATLRHGVLTLHLPKVAEEQPRQISVTAA
jgi:HSP20 family protein